MTFEHPLPFNQNKALRCRALEHDADVTHISGDSTTCSKRVRKHEATESASTTMEVDVIGPPPPPAFPSGGAPPLGTPSGADAAMNHADQILVQMVQSGNYSYDQVVQFCIQSGIPLSRMLRLDLMRLNDSNNNNNNFHATK